MRVFAKSDIGKARNMNQDNYYIPQEDDNIQLFVLADGMGGYNGGEIASSLAVQSIIIYVKFFIFVYNKIKLAPKILQEVIFQPGSSE